MGLIEPSLIPLMPEHSEWACELCGAVIALDREADEPLRWLEVHRRWHANQQGAVEAIRTLLDHADRGTDDTWLVRHSDVQRLRALTNPGGQ